MTEEEEKAFTDFIEKHKDKIIEVNSEYICRNAEEAKWLFLYRLFSDQTKENFKKRVKIE